MNILIIGASRGIGHEFVRQYRAAGDTVTFTNQDSAPHTATSDAGAFDTGRLNKGASSSLTFGGKGDFAYHCNIHRSMKAVIHVA